VTSAPTGAASGAAADDFKRAADALRPDRSRLDPRLRGAAGLLERGSAGLATNALREFLARHPRDANALYLLAEAAARQGRNAEMQALLAQCIEAAPDFTAGRFRYANALMQANRPEAALIEADALLKKEPRNPLFRRLKALALEGTQDFAAAAELWRGLIEDYPARYDCWERYGHALRGMGLREDAIAAYRKTIALNPGYGGAWWSLADLKTFRFNDADTNQMESQLARADLAAGDRPQIHFALGKAYDDKKLYEKSFGHYAKGNALYRLGFDHNPDVMTAYVAACRKLFTADFFRDRAVSGCSTAGPIFIVGMPRSGSTLVEQILASHSQIEATRELPNLATVSWRLQQEAMKTYGIEYPAVLAKLDAAVLARAGEHYLESVRAHRKFSRPFFIDKMGSNFLHTGLLHLILPNAKIVDVRRHPLACCFSIFAQMFPKGQNDSYDLMDIGRAYRDYVDLMAHVDTLLPGKVHRVFYEDLVARPEAEIRRLLDHVGVPFERACVAFHKTDRVVTTASSEQVRSPIYRSALEHWQHYEPWLEPLMGTLGSVVTAYPAVPAEMR
jgi:tetratricopeptide (TPR) repeat protein